MIIGIIMIIGIGIRIRIRIGIRIRTGGLIYLQTVWSSVGQF